MSEEQQATTAQPVTLAPAPASQAETAPAPDTMAAIRRFVEANREKAAAAEAIPQEPEAQPVEAAPADVPTAEATAQPSEEAPAEPARDEAAELRAQLAAAQAQLQQLQSKPAPTPKLRTSDPLGSLRAILAEQFPDDPAAQTEYLREALVDYASEAAGVAVDSGSPEEKVRRLHREVEQLKEQALSAESKRANDQAAYGRERARVALNASIRQAASELPFLANHPDSDPGALCIAEVERAHSVGKRYASEQELLRAVESQLKQRYQPFISALQPAAPTSAGAGAGSKLPAKSESPPAPAPTLRNSDASTVVATKPDPLPADPRERAEASARRAMALRRKQAAQ